MRSTVGPLSPAVYWRRRAVVLGALLLVVILLFVSCGGNGEDTKRGAGKGTSGSQAPTPAPEDSESPEPEPSFGTDKPNEPVLPDPDAVQSGTPAVPNPTPGNAANGTNNNVDAPANGSCADQALSLSPLPAATTIKTGAQLTIHIKIKNTSPTACTRDLGAGAQELYIDQGARKFWSSDTCSADRSTNPTKMQPGTDYNFAITWNGHQANKCQAALPTGPALPPGQYQLRARLDRKISDPVAITVTA